MIEAQRDAAATAANAAPVTAADGTEFNSIASAISKDINVTVAKLTKLSTS